MTERVVVTLASTPKLGAHMRLRHDRVRDCWTIQAPERSFMLDMIAHSIVSRCDGVVSVGHIVETLCDLHPDAPREIIEADVLRLIQDFADKAVMTA